MFTVCTGQSVLPYLPPLPPTDPTGFSHGRRKQFRTDSTRLTRGALLAGRSHARQFSKTAQNLLVNTANSVLACQLQ
jgi:hypothetical protein